MTSTQFFNGIESRNRPTSRWVSSAFVHSLPCAVCYSALSWSISKLSRKMEPRSLPALRYHIWLKQTGFLAKSSLRCRATTFADYWSICSSYYYYCYCFYLTWCCYCLCWQVALYLIASVTQLPWLTRLESRLGVISHWSVADLSSATSIKCQFGLLHCHSTDRQ